MARYKYIPQAGDTTEDELQGKIRELKDTIKELKNRGALTLSKDFWRDSKGADWRFERGSDFYVAWAEGKEVLACEYIPNNYPALTVYATPLAKFRRETLPRLKKIGYEPSEKW